MTTEPMSLNRSYPCQCGRSEVTFLEDLSVAEILCEVCPTVLVRLDDGTERRVHVDDVDKGK